MAFWTWFGLKSGEATTRWPKDGADDGQAGVLGMPRYAPERCEAGCTECGPVCPTGAIAFASGTADRVTIDYGRCVVCQLCTEACPTGALAATGDWVLAVRRREDLVRPATAGAVSGGARPLGAIRRSLHIRHVDAGSCNGCESELQALDNPFYNLHRLGIFFTASPRFADLLLVTGTVTEAMRAPLLATYAAMPEPRFVMATGACAISGGIAAGGYASGRGLEGVLPVDLYLPGCPPNPAAIITALLTLQGRFQGRTTGGGDGE